MNEETYIRTYEPGDKEQVQECIGQMQAHLESFEPEIIANAESIKEAYYAYISEQVQKKDGAMFVAVASGRVVGFGAGWQNLDADEKEIRFHISDLVVLQEYRNKGIGTLLVQELEKFGRSKGIKFASINVLTENEGALRLYERLGFRRYAATLIKPI